MLARDWRLRNSQMLTAGSEGTQIGTFDDRPQIPRNMLFRNRGDGTFEEIANYAGVTAANWAWQPVFMDVDLDGFEDIIISTGFFRDANNMDAMAKYSVLRRAGKLVPPKLGPDGKPVSRSAQEQKTEELYQLYQLADSFKTPVVAFRNLGKLKFEETGPAWG